MSEVKIHSGSRVKLKKVDELALDQEFLNQLRELSHRTQQVEAVFLFAMQREEGAESFCLMIAIKKKIFGDGNEEFLQFVEEIQMILPEDLPVNIYRFGTSDFLSSFCAHKIEPIHLRTRSWLDRQKKKFPLGTA